MYKIYVLEKNNIPFYIGKTKNTNRRKNRHKQKYGQDIDLIILDEGEDWKFLEKYWIEQFRYFGFVLSNKNKGGGGPHQWTEEQKLNINPDRILKIKNHPTRNQKISKSLNITKHSIYYTDEVKDKIRNALKGKSKPFTDEHIQSIKESRRKTSKKVYQFDLQGNFIKEWKSKGEAAEHIVKEKHLKSNVVSQIKDCILGYQKTAFGYVWRYDNTKQNVLFNPIYQFDINKKLTNCFNSLKSLKKWIQENRKEIKDINTLSSRIKRESKKRIYKSGNNYYNVNKEI
jgi:hypothetical protein